MAYTAPVSGGSATATAADTNWKESAIGIYAYAADAGGTDAYAITLAPALTSYVTGQHIKFKANTANTGPATLNVNALGAKTIKKNITQDLDSNDILANQIIEVVYDGTNFQMVSFPLTLLRGFDIGLQHSTGINGDYAGTEVPSGYGGPNNLTFGTYNNGSGNGCCQFVVDIATDIGVQPFLKGKSPVAVGVPSTRGVVYTGTNYFLVDSSSNVYKDGSTITVASGSGVNGPLGHDSVNAYLLMATSATNVRRYSGIATTTISQVDNITLDTAITTGMGFLYDTVNQQYVFLDTTNNVLRRFSSTGVTVDTTAYTFNDALVYGVQMIGRRVYIVVQSSGRGTSEGDVSVSVQLIPTTLVM